MPKNDDAPDAEGIQPEDSLAQAAYRVLRHQFRRLREEEPGTPRATRRNPFTTCGWPTRRLRAALRAFNAVLPERATERFLNEFRWLGNALGQVRDLDVYLRLLSDPAGLSEEAAAGLAEYRGEIQQQRNQARTRMLRALNSARYQRLLAAFAPFLSEGPPPAGGGPSAAVGGQGLASWPRCAERGAWAAGSMPPLRKQLCTDSASAASGCATFVSSSPPCTASRPTSWPRPRP